jgi:hypothetical protein
MPDNLLYMPTFRARQQEIIVLKSFDFQPNMYPLIEVIKAKDRSNNRLSAKEIYDDLIAAVRATKVFVDLPTYIKDYTGMQQEVVTFNRTVLSNIDRRIEFYNSLDNSHNKIIPIVSTLQLKTRASDTITEQFRSLRENFQSIAIRTFTNTFLIDELEIRALLTPNDYLIYDIDESIGLTNPIITRDRVSLASINTPFKIALRSAVRSDIQNIGLDHDEIVYDADNSLLTLFHSYGFNAFGDYVGIKKDDLTAGGTISPGFIFYDPVTNLFYGYKGDFKNLDQFELTIVPDVLRSPVSANIMASNSAYLNADNEGWTMLNRIHSGAESGKSQAKFKRIAMEHYLHCIRVKIQIGEIA